jgi:23S rRNA (guanine745-N1)-methyltransferase
MPPFPSIDQIPGHIPMQSKPWCDQLAAMTGKYEFPWREIADGERIVEKFAARLRSRLRGRVLDVGCGHGEFTVQWAGQCEEVVGFDMTEGFIATARRDHSRDNVRYVVGRTHDGMPFPDGYFDFAYTKKGPTSWYSEAARIVKPGGELFALHPGDGTGIDGELGLAFPGLFGPPGTGTPILDRLREQLENSGLTDISLTRHAETVWLPSPEDVFEMVCFGQNDTFRTYVRNNLYTRIAERFGVFREEKGLRASHVCYWVEAKVPG